MDCTRPLIGFIQSCFGEAEHYTAYGFCIMHTLCLINVCLPTQLALVLAFYGATTQEEQQSLFCIDLEGFVGVRSILSVFIGLLVKPFKKSCMFSPCWSCEKNIETIDRAM